MTLPSRLLVVWLILAAHGAEGKKKLPKLNTVYELAEYAEKKLSKTPWSYLTGTATYGTTIIQNEAAFQKLKIIPDHMIPVGNFDPSLTVLGSEISMPIGIAPTAYQHMFHEDGEIATVKAAKASQTVHILSEWASTLLEDVADAAPDAVRWMQVQFSNPKNMSLDVARRAEAAGYRALVLTIDWPVSDILYSWDFTKVFYPGSPAYTNMIVPHQSITNPNQSWDDVADLVTSTSLPVLIKGLLDPASVPMVKQVGAAGIIVSNHGAHTLDGAPAAIEMLPRVVEAVEAAGGGLDVYMDGGVRTGIDVYRALALGAKMVFLGRPTLYGLTYNGQKGVEKVLELLRDEFVNTAQMACSPTLASINRHRIIPQAQLDLM